MDALVLLVGSVHWLDDIWLAISFLLGARTPGLAQREFLLRNGAVLRTGQEIQRFAGKRVVTRGWLNGKRVVAKFYLGAFGQWWEWYRGLRGARAFLAAGVPAPTVHYGGYLSEIPAWVTVLDHVEVDEVWPPDGDAMTETVHFRLLAVLANQHAHGIQQNDLNTRNFLPHGGQLYSIDGDRARRRGEVLSRSQALANLVRFYGGKTALPESAVRAGYRYYCEQREWPWTEADEERFLARVRLARLATATRVAARSLRGWKHYRLRRQSRRWSIVDRRLLRRNAELDYLSLPPGADSSESLTTVNELPLRVRRLAGETMGVGLSSLVLGSRPMRAWVKSVLLRRLKLPVERPVAVVEQRLGILRREGYLLLHTGENTLPARLALAAASPEMQHNQVQQIVTLASRLRGLRLTHDHFRLDALGVNDGRVLLLDVEGVRRYPRWLPGFDAVWTRDMRPIVRELAAVVTLPAGLEDSFGLAGVAQAPANDPARITPRDD